MANEKQQPGGDPEQARLKKEEQARKTHRRNRQLMGFALSILILVGAVSIVRSGVNLVTQMMDNTAEIDTYNRRIAPLVWFDPLPFESLPQADENRLRSACIWGLLDQRKESGEQLEQNAEGDTLIPAAALDRYAASLFGPEFTFSPPDGDAFYDEKQQMDYPYDAENQVYHIPATSPTIEYVSTVVEMKRESDGILRVTAAYVSIFGSDDRIIDAPDYENPERYMDFMFRRDGSEYYLYALETNNTYVPPVASSSETDAQSSLSTESNATVVESSLPSTSASEVPGSAPATLPETPYASGTDSENDSDTSLVSLPAASSSFVLEP